MTRTCAERAKEIEEVGSTESELRERRQGLTMQADNLLGWVQTGHGNPLLMERPDSLQSQIDEIEKQLAVIGERVPSPPTREAANAIVEKKLSELSYLLQDDSELSRKRLREHFLTFTMTPVDTSDGPRYEINGEIRVLAPDDPDGVLLDSSFKSTVKHYTTLSFPLKATVITRSDEWKRQKS